MSRTKLLFVMGLSIAPAALAQVPAGAESALKFEVASLKPNDGTGQGPFGIRPAPGGERYLATNTTLKLLITVAYRVKAEQVIGGPDWINTVGWDMNAKAERPSSPEELHAMLANLMAERFKLQFHREKKDLPIYVLSVEKSEPSPALKPHQSQNAGEPWIDVAQPQFLHMKLSGKFCPMDYFAWRLGALLDRPVVDQTKLKGGYDFELAYTRDPPLGLPEGALLNGQPVDVSGPNIFSALKQQLGLKLEPRKGPVEVIVIDHAEKAGDN